MRSGAVRRYDAVIVFGPPYAGKGTQCKLLAQKLEFYHFSSGEMFRNLDSTTAVGARAQEIHQQILEQIVLKK
ncbi:nucleoside monophosphate kinase [Candidatus Woesearchaeota archaeon]|nr:nucleoside monophosphate kinase [Candidatus Woesearchaeota archaeon]